MDMNFILNRKKVIDQILLKIKMAMCIYPNCEEEAEIGGYCREHWELVIEE